MAMSMQFPLRSCRGKVEMLRLRYLINAVVYSLHFIPVQYVCRQTFRPSANWNREYEQLMYTETTLVWNAIYSQVASELFSIAIPLKFEI